MKKSELKSTAKAETKKIKKEIETSLINGLKTVTAKLGKSTDKLDKKIGKGSKKLAKKLAKEVKPDQPVKTDKVKPVAVKSEKAKPVSKVKPVTEKTPAKVKIKKDAANS